MVTTRGKSEVDVHQDNMASTRTTRSSDKSNANSNNASPAKKKQERRSVLKEGTRNSPASPVRRRSTRRSPRNSKDEDLSDDADMRGNFEAAEVSQEDKENRKKSSSPSSKRGVPAEAHGDSPSKRRKSDESEQKEEALGEDKGLNEFEGSDMDEDEEELFTSRSSAASTAKRGSGYDNEELVDLCVKVLTQGCGLHTGTPLLLAEARSNHEQQNTTEDDQDQQEEEEDEEAVYAGFASSLVGQLTSEGNTEGSNPAFLLFGKRSKTLEKNFVHFWNQLVTLMHGKETLYSDSQGVDFLTCMRHVCVELSKSEVRAFRYAACVCGYAILGSLAQVHQVLSETNVLLTKQLRATDSRNKGQRKDINKRMQVCHERTNIVDINMKTLFQELVIVRFRDVAPQVRALTIQWVGTWVVLHPQKFLSDGYLKYVAWSLNDKDAHVRVSAVDALKKVYQKHAVSTDGTTSATEGGASGAGSFSNFSALDLLTQRFHGRFTELIRDNDEQVCVNALELVVCLAKAGLVDVHSKEIDSNVALLLLDKSDKVRVNAGKLAACMVDQRLSKKQKRASNKRRGSKSSQEKENKTGDNKTGDCIEVCKILCKLVVEGLPESVVERSWDQLHNSPSSILTGEEEVFVGAITAVIPHLSPDLIHDWDVLAEACKTRKGANSSEETLVNVVRVVLAAIRHFTSPKMIRQSLTKRTSRSAIVDLCEMSQQKFTLSFMRVLSILLAQCKSKVGLVFNRLSCLLSALCSKMKQELFVAKRDSEKDFESIVQSLHDLCLKTNSTHIDSMQEDTPETLDTHVMSCLRCLMSLDKSGAAVTREKAQKKLKDILEGLLKDAVKVMGLINGKELAPAKAGKKSKRSKRSSKGMYDMSSLDEDAVFKLRSHLHRVHALQQLGVFQPASVSEEKGETLDTVFFDSLQDLIGQCCDLDDEDYMLEHSTMQMACLNIFDSLLWKLQGIQQEIPDSLDVLDTFTKDRIVILLDMLQKFVNQLETLYSLYPTSEGLQKTIYTIILDLTFSFQKCAAKWTAKIEEEDLKEEILEKVVPGTEVFKVLWDFCKKECFDVLLDKKKDAKGDDDNTNELVAAQNVLSPLLRLLTSGNALSSPGSLWLVPELFSYTSIANKIVSNALKKLWQSTHLMETSLEHADGSHDSRRLTTEDKIKMYVRGLKVAYLRWKDSDMNADRLALNQLCTFIGRHHKKNPTVLLGMLELAIGNDEEEENGESAALEPMELVNEVLVQYIDKLDEGDVKKLAKVVSKSTGKQHLQELYQLLQEMDPEISDDDYEEHSEDDDGGEQDQDKVHQMEEDNEEDEGKEEIPPPPPRSTRRRL